MSTVIAETRSGATVTIRKRGSFPFTGQEEGEFDLDTTRHFPVPVGSGNYLSLCCFFMSRNIERDDAGQQETTQ